MAEDVAATVASLRTRCELARDAKVRAAAAREQADQQLSQAVSALKAEFGVETPEQARGLMEDLDRQIAAEAARIDQALGAAQ